VRISELAERVGVPSSTVRFYERIGLVAAPARTPSGYRDYDESAAARLLFVTRARRMGLTCEQIAEVLPAWDGVNCGVAHEEVTRLVEAKRAEIAERIAELQRFAAQLDEVGTTLQQTPPPTECRSDLSCCIPDAGGEGAPVPLVRKSRSAANA
jgi:DNA-binding transcriptional MerR regulator